MSQLNQYKQVVTSFLLSFLPEAAMLAKYWITRLVLTVFPAPDSPLETQPSRINVHWME